MTNIMFVISSLIPTVVPFRKQPKYDIIFFIDRTQLEDITKPPFKTNEKYVLNV